MKHNTELIAVIRKIVKDNRDVEFLPEMALMACNEIERLAEELYMFKYAPYTKKPNSIWR